MRTAMVAQEAPVVTNQHVIDNRVFVLALDHLYREAMMPHERGELLTCAQEVASVLAVAPATSPVEGYYAEDVQLSEYFRLVRALQQVDRSRRSQVAELAGFQRLDHVMSAAIYGRPEYQGKLLPVSRDALSQALLDTRPRWTVPRVTAAALAAAQKTDDISLVGLAARAQDAVVLTALRESVVLYAEEIWLGIPPEPELVWQVDEDLAECATRFVNALNALFDTRLPAAIPEMASRYWRAYEHVRVVGRCVCLGRDDGELPIRRYHWAICAGPNGQLAVHEFWHREIWTTARYRTELPVDERPDS